MLHVNSMKKCLFSIHASMRYEWIYAVVTWVDPAIGVAGTSETTFKIHHLRSIYNLLKVRNKIYFRIVSINLIIIA